jgi:hypothetical protein
MPVVPNKTFAQAYCAYYNCPPEAFVDDALQRCVFPHARRWMTFFNLVGARTAMEACAFIDTAGYTRSKEELKDLIGRYHSDIKPRGTIFIRKFKIRVSCERLLLLHAKIRDAQIQNELPL